MQKLKNNINYILISLVFILISAWSILTPPWSDDMRNISNGKGISLKEIIVRQYDAYFNWSGRVIGESIASLLTSIGRIPFGFLNGFIFTSLTILVLLISNNNKLKGKYSFCKYSFILFLFLGLIPSFGQIILWTSGSGNYLWTATLNILFLYLFIYKIDKNNKLLYCMMFPISLLSGWSNENTGIGIISLLLIYIILNFKTIKFIYMRLFILLIYTVGYSFLIFAPGNANRASILDTYFMSTSIFSRISIRFIGVNDAIYRHLMFSLILLSIFISIKLVNKKYEFLIKEILPYAVGILATLYSLLLSPELDQNAGRMFFMSFILISIATVKCINFDSKDYEEKLINTFIFIIVASFAFLSLSSGFIDSIKTNIALHERYEFIDKKKKNYNHNSGIFVPPLSYIGTTKYSEIKETNFDMNSDSNSTYNKTMSNAFGITKITVTEKN